MRTTAPALLCSLLACNNPDAATGDTTSEAHTTTTTSSPTTSTSSTASTTRSSPSTSTTITTTSSSSEGTTGEPSCSGELPPHWIDGTDCASEPQVQVHAYDEHTYILRQSLCTSFEAPFMYLLFGSERALLLDTGDGGIPIQDIVRGVIDGWSQAHGGAQVELIVANTHAHGDHTAGNDLFVGQADTTVVGTGVAAVASFFGITDWPNQTVAYDLGGRPLDIIPIPGHQSSHIGVYDRTTGIAFTGDTLYPGRLYIAEFPTYVASVARLADHLADQQVCHILGAHIEMTTTPGEDFDYMQPAHPDEHRLQLGHTHLLELRAAVEAMPTPTLEVHDDFIVYPL